MLTHHWCNGIYVRMWKGNTISLYRLEHSTIYLRIYVGTIKCHLIFVQREEKLLADPPVLFDCGQRWLQLVSKSKHCHPRRIRWAALVPRPSDRKNCWLLTDGSIRIRMVPAENHHPLNWRSKRPNDRPFQLKSGQNFLPDRRWSSLSTHSNCGSSIHGRDPSEACPVPS